MMMNAAIQAPIIMYSIFSTFMFHSSKKPVYGMEPETRPADALGRLILDVDFSFCRNGVVQNSSEPFEQFFFVSGQVRIHQDDNFDIAQVSDEVIGQFHTGFVLFFS